MPDENIESNPNAPEWRDYLRLMLIALDDNSKLWPPTEVRKARNAFARTGVVPSGAHYAELFGEQALDSHLRAIAQERVAEMRFHAQLQGDNDPCHVCGKSDGLTYHEFGLAMVHSTKRDWKMTGISVAISAVTLPLLGAGSLATGKTTSGNLLKLRLVLCPTCLNERQNFFGVFVSKERHCQVHPLWTDLHSAGFTKFVPKDQLLRWV
jgi:hypothetical protein